MLFVIALSTGGLATCLMAVLLWVSLASEDASAAGRQTEQAKERPYDSSPEGRRPELRQ